MAIHAMRRGGLPPARVPSCAALRRDGGRLLALTALLALPLAAGAQTAAPPARPDSPSDPDAGLFLEEAAYGPTQTDLAHVKSLGLRAWLNEQYSLPISDYSNLSVATNSDTFYARKRFFENAIYQPDQLRQRVTFALSQFDVVSIIAGFESTNRQPAIASYMDVLNRNSFGNFRQLMYELSTNPSVGAFLNSVNNDKPDATKNSLPNENYARELMQLYTIGVYQLNPDGSYKLDGNGQKIQNYGNDEIKAFARVFTGWTYPTQPGMTLAKHNPAYFVGPMVPYASNHDIAAKTLLGGQIIPANQTADADMNAAMDNIFKQPSLPPFVCRRLIQHLVTSNPSPAYLQRVVNVFINNGSGVRGDMKAVLSAILLDGEAVGNIKTNPTFGHLREPAQFLANTIRLFHPVGDLYGVADVSTTFGQNIFDAPSVFSYYVPDFSLFTVNNAGTPYSFYSPEAQLISTNTGLARINYVNTLIYGSIYTPTYLMPAPTSPTTVTIDMSAYDASASNPAVLVDKLNRYVMHGTMSSDMSASIVTAVSAVSATSLHSRVQTAVYLILSSQQYQSEGSGTYTQNVLGIANYPDVVNKAQTLRFEFRPVNGDTSFVRIANLDSAGTFNVPYIPPGKYTVAVRGPVFLQKVVSVDTTTGDVSGLSVPLTPGDSNGDNSVDSTDFGILIGDYGAEAAIPNSGYDPKADFNCDGKVDSSDFALLIGAFGMTGDN